MEEWEREHPESTFTKVMETVDNVIKIGQPFLELVPDSPFPARSLVQGLAHLLQLGTEIASAKTEVYDFTMQVSTWFYTVEASFQTAEKKFTPQARKNLDAIRNLINEICKWGWARLNDRRWMSIMNSLTISGEIKLFKEKLTEARDLFSTIQDINLVMSVDEILTEVLIIKRYTKCQFGKILDHLRERELSDERRRYLEKTLNPDIALRRTAYDDQGKPPCDEDTRIDILADITTWVNDVSPHSQNFFWLTGDPGCGKSAITASLARYCKGAGTLWAQLFINRNNEATTNPRVYFPSIAHQLAEHSPNKTVEKAIYAILKANPWVVGCIIVLKEPLSIGDVGALLDLRRTSTSNPIDILHFATNLRTVLVAGTGEITVETIPRLHKSFVEFITSEKAEQFQIDPEAVDVEIALKCLQLVRRLSHGDDRSGIPPPSLRYAIHNWTRHLPNEGIASGVAIFGDEAFPGIYTSAAALRKSVMSVSGDYRTHIYDPWQGFPPPSALHFSDSSTIRVGDELESLAISMDGRLIAVGTHSGDIHILDSRSHKLSGEPLQGHSCAVNSICFSLDSRWLVSGGDDHSVHGTAKHA